MDKQGKTGRETTGISNFVARVTSPAEDAQVRLVVRAVRFVFTTSRRRRRSERQRGEIVTVPT